MYTTTGTQYTNTSAEVGKTYYYKVRAVRGEQSSEYSTIKSRTCDLARPTITVSLNNNGRPKISWNAVDGAEKYEIYRATSENGTYSCIITTTKTEFTNTVADKGRAYYYKVRALHSNVNANSAYSAIESTKKN